MARGSKGAFGRRINEPWIFGPLLLLFVVGLFDWRRILSLRNLDLVALASFTVSLWYFNEGLVFWSRAAAVPAADLPVRAAGGDRLRPRPRRASYTDALARLAGRGPGGLRDGLPGRPQLLVVQRDRRRLRERGRIRPAAVRGDPVQPHAEGHAARRAARSTRTARTRPTSRPAARASRRSSAATRTGRSCTTPTSRPPPRSAGPAAGTTCRPRTGRPSIRRAGRRRPRASRGGASAAAGSPRRCCSAGRRFRSPPTRCRPTPTTR